MGGVTLAATGREATRTPAPDAGNERLFTAARRNVGMSTETADRRDSHIQSLIVIAVTTLGGIVAGFVTPEVATSATDQAAFAVVGVALLLELGIMQVLGIEVREFSTKDQLYVLFMTFSMWYVAWAILLTTQGV